MSENEFKKLFLLDAYALIYRSYYAFIRNPQFNSKGVNTSAMLGFTNSLVQLLEAEDPHYVGVVFDVSAPTFRHEMYAEYKAKRDVMPEDLRASIPYIRNIVEAFNIPIIELKGYEADDVIGTLAQKAKTEGFDTYMMTPDKDYAQLVEPNIRMYKPAKQGAAAEIWGPGEVLTNYNLENTRQMIDLLGLMGDASDNVPGCPGVGPKTAQKLIADFGSIDGIYNNLDKIKGKLKDNLIANKELVFLSKELVTINVNVPIGFDKERLIRQELNKEALKKIFDDLEFKNLSKRLNLEDVKPVGAVQQSLFGGETASQLETASHQNIQT